MSIKVTIIDDDRPVREGLQELINGSPDFSCNRVFSTAEEAIDKLDKRSVDVVLMDIQLPGISGIDCVRRLKEMYPEILIVMLTVYEDEDAIFKSLVAGASGYLLKKTPPQKLLESLEDVYRGGSPMSSQIARKVVSFFQQTNPEPDGTENLTNRENEILAYLAKGFRYKEIADTLFISIETVRTHIRHIYEKLQVRSRTEAVLKYLNK